MKPWPSLQSVSLLASILANSSKHHITREFIRCPIGVALQTLGSFQICLSALQPHLAHSENTGLTRNYFCVTAWASSAWAPYLLPCHLAKVSSSFQVQIKDHFLSDIFLTPFSLLPSLGSRKPLQLGGILCTPSPHVQCSCSYQ